MTEDRSQANRGLADIVGGLAGDVRDMVKGEIALARTELDQKLHRSLMALVRLAGGALVGFAGLVVLLEGVAMALALVMRPWAAAMIVGLVIIAIGVVLARSGLAALSVSALAPDRTTASLRDDARMMKEHL